MGRETSIYYVKGWPCRAVPAAGAAKKPYAYPVAEGNVTSDESSKGSARGPAIGFEAQLEADEAFQNYLVSRAL